MIWLAAVLLQAEPQRMPLQVSTDQKSVQGVIHLSDESSVAHLITAFGKDDVSIEVKDNKVFVKLLRAVEGSVDCIGASGTLYRVTLVPSPTTVPLLTLRSPPARKRPEPELPRPLQLMRSMRLGQAPEGTDVRRSTAVLVDDPTFIVQLLWVYRFDELTGYVCTLRNRSSETIRIDPSRIRAPGLRVVGVKDLRLEAGQVTRLYAVVEAEHE
jgi:hypothetical protein